MIESEEYLQFDTRSRKPMTMIMMLKIAKRKAYKPYLQVQPVQHHKQALTYYLKILYMTF